MAAGPGGAVAVAFYDRRRPCPDDASVLPADVGRTNFCIDTSLQAYKDSGSGAVAVGANVRSPSSAGIRSSRASTSVVSASMAVRWPRRSVHAVEVHRRLLRPRRLRQNVYGLFVSTHYPSAVTADEGGPVYYQQQVLAKVPRSAIGAGY